MHAISEGGGHDCDGWGQPLSPGKWGVTQPALEECTDRPFTCQQFKTLLFAWEPRKTIGAAGCVSARGFAHSRAVLYRKYHMRVVASLRQRGTQRGASGKDEPMEAPERQRTTVETPIVVLEPGDYSPRVFWMISSATFLGTSA